MENSSLFRRAGVGLLGAICGSCSMMLFTGAHDPGIAGNPLSIAVASAAELTNNGSDQERIVNAVKSVQPSVVSLFVTVNGTRVVPPDPASQFFGGQPGIGQTQRFHERASGSGFVYNQDGLILTNAHVVPKGTTGVMVVFANGDHIPAKVYSSDPAIDLALVKVNNYAKLPQPVQFGDSSQLNAGQWAIAIGEPFELKDSVAVGVVSGFDRDEPIRDESGRDHLFRGMLQTSAPINPGNSGGPLIDDLGHVIGVNQSTANPQAGAQGIGFAIPSNVVRKTAVELANSPGKTLDANTTGTGVAYLGVGLEPLDRSIRTQLSYPQNGLGGVVVGQIPPDGPAAKADLSPGDVIQKFDGHSLKTPDDLMNAVKALKPGQIARLQVWSAGTKKLVLVPLGEQPPEVFLQQQKH
jgi:S1-C subfamily serine protease